MARACIARRLTCTVAINFCFRSDREERGGTVREPSHSHPPHRTHRKDFTPLGMEIRTGVGGVHVNPNVLVPADFRDLVQTVERTAARSAQRGHHEKRDEPVFAILVNGVAERVTAKLVLAVRVQRAQ